MLNICNEFIDVYRQVLRDFYLLAFLREKPTTFVMVYMVTMWARMLYVSKNRDGISVRGGGEGIH